jgi:hypothetical protein
LNVSLFSHLYQEDLYRFTNPVIVVLSRAWDSHGSEEKILLNKILTSVKVDINAVRFIVQPRTSLSALSVYGPARVLIFGAELEEALTSYEAVAAQGFIAIRADDLSQLDDQKKKNLWLALRQMFSV